MDENPIKTQPDILDDFVSFTFSDQSEKLRETISCIKTFETKLEAKVDASDTTVTRQNNTFNNANQLVKLNSDGQLPVLDGSLLTGKASLDLSNITLAAALNNIGFTGHVYGYNGYYKFPNGLTVQWGYIPFTGLNLSTWTFPIAFPNTCVYADTQIYWGNNYRHASIQWNTTPNTSIGFFPNTDCGGGINGYCFAIGY